MITAITVVERMVWCHQYDDQTHQDEEDDESVRVADEYLSIGVALLEAAQDIKVRYG